MAAIFVNGSAQNEQSLERTFHRCFLPSFTSFGWGVSEEKIKMWKVNGRQTTDAKWWQKLTLPLARWAKQGHSWRTEEVKIKLALPFMVADLVYEFQMKCLRGTYIIEEKPKWAYRQRWKIMPPPKLEHKYRWQNLNHKQMHPFDLKL